MSEKFNQMRYIRQFSIMFVLGIILVISSFMLIPAFLMIFPQIIAMLLNFGVLLILGSFSIIKGGVFKYFCNHLICKGSFFERFIAIALYASMTLNIYEALIKFNFFLTIFSMIIVLICLLYFVCSSFPGGTAGVNLLCKLLRQVICRCY